MAPFMDANNCDLYYQPVHTQEHCAYSIGFTCRGSLTPTLHKPPPPPRVIQRSATNAAPGSSPPGRGGSNGLLRAGSAGRTCPTPGQPWEARVTWHRQDPGCPAPLHSQVTAARCGVGGRMSVHSGWGAGSPPLMGANFPRASGPLDCPQIGGVRFWPGPCSFCLK